MTGNATTVVRRLDWLTREHWRIGPVRLSPAALAVMALGATLQIARFAACRSLWLDEAFLQVSITGRSLAELVASPLACDQSAPVGYLYMVKLATLAFGESEYGLRLVALLSGLALLVAAWVAARRLMPSGPALLALALLAVAEPVIYFASELKQYETEALVTLLVLLAADRATGRSSDGAPQPALCGLAIVGVLAIAFSHSAIFILAGVGVALFADAIRRRERTRMAVLAGVGTLWVGCFVLSYAVLIAPMATVDSVRAFWAGGFLPVAPSFRTVQQWTYLMLHGAQHTLDVRVGGLAFVLAVAGLVVLRRDDAQRAAVFALPLLIVVLASVLELYPLLGRMVLFLAPLVALLIALGVHALAQWRAPRVVIGVIVALLVVPPAAQSLDRLADPPGREEIRYVLQQAAAQSHPGDLLVVRRVAIHQFDYYTRRGVCTFDSPAPVLAPNHQRFADLLSALRRHIATDRRFRPGVRVWVIHIAQELLVLPDSNPIADIAVELSRIVAPGACAVLYQLR